MKKLFPLALALALAADAAPLISAAGAARHGGYGAVPVRDALSGCRNRRAPEGAAVPQKPPASGGRPRDRLSRHRRISPSDWKELYYVKPTRRVGFFRPVRRFPEMEFPAKTNFRACITARS